MQHFFQLALLVVVAVDTPNVVHNHRAALDAVLALLCHYMCASAHGVRVANLQHRQAAMSKAATAISNRSKNNEQTDNAHAPWSGSFSRHLVER